MAKEPMVRMPPRREKPAPDLDAETKAAAYVAGASVGTTPEKRTVRKRGRPPRPQRLVQFTLALPDTLMQQVVLLAEQTRQPKRIVIEEAVAIYVAEKLGGGSRKKASAK
jgi:hypothetical protein